MGRYSTPRIRYDSSYSAISLWAVNADERIFKRTGTLDRYVNTLTVPFNINVFSADNNTVMNRMLSVKSDEIPSINW
jgi:hypothetical protein